ncbi:glycerol dehydratase reactivase beta/small subunit family protein [Actinomycetospora soli]|uniref:glycerol dehydratase reactivase beta/small subunit family protein n=1 Tax=Actinomycetospora soli TaxID=2893887 RepID=UPI001E2BBC70|nr:glycerol dehydratase reactivase beta/small subunit family protein [Actinomycetospora soli]MCD2188799.1 glycerol dehydratase reactivase beta/small subunit family protein [Actinomycetospora soli]
MSDAAEGPPTVVVAAHPGAPPGVLREVRAGAEEQGVPTALLPDAGSSPDAAARRGAADSRLQVGVGIGDDGAVVVRHALVPDAVLVLGPDAPAGEQRQAGADAARIVGGGALRAGEPAAGL